MDWDPEQDARNLAVRLHNLDSDYVGCVEVAVSAGWAARRFNPAIAYLVSARIASSHEYMGAGEFWPPAVSVGAELLRFVRSR